MKYAIMSDAHANPTALETALADAHRARCGKFILLGDVTGYGYDPKRTLELVRKNFDVVLMGNHDSACVGLEPEWEVKENYNYDFDRIARELLTEEERFMRPAMRVESVTFRLNPASRYIVNVGSVGYPRNDLCCSYGIYDADARRMTIRRLPFDFKSYVTEMLDRGLSLPGWLCQLLLAAQAG